MLRLAGADVEAAEAVRSLVEKVVLVPVDGKLAIDLYGEIDTILKLAMAQNGGDVLGPVSEQLVMVAGARTGRYRHRPPFTLSA